MFVYIGEMFIMQCEQANMLLLDYIYTKWTLTCPRCVLIVVAISR